MVSALSPQQFRQPEQVDLAGSYLSGKNAYQKGQMNDQAIQQNQQEISRADYEQAQQRLVVLGRLAEKAKELPLSERYAFAQSINPELLQSVGIDPKTVSSQQLDDNSLNSLIALAKAHSPQSGQYRKESVSTNQGLMVFDPSTGSYVAAKGSDGSPLSAAQYDASLQGQIAGAKAGATNQSDLAYDPEIERRKKQAVADVEASTRPAIEGAVTAARNTAEQEANKRQSQAVASDKLDDAEAIYSKLMNADLDKIYGRGESVYPELMRSQEGIDLIANRDQFVSMLKVGARGELKGQGAVSDSDAKTVSEAATILGNPNISPAAAKEASDRAIAALRRSAGKGKPLGGSGQGSSAPGITGKTAGAKLTYDPATRTFK